ncbi:MAG: crossover junction endodeoxyribonuclease RuvC [Acidimicrobiia bacterium]|nr:MAG: crossover junction endodeoxyribonuclease RuvC [Acidimicrobiia bacterium]
MFVLGIDPGLSTLGYGVIEGGSVVRPVAVGVIRTDPALATSVRLQELAGDLEAIIAEYRPDQAAIEEVFVNRNLHSALGVGRASGVAILLAARAGMEVHEYTPTEVKKAVTGRGDASKAQVQHMVARRLGLAAAPAPADAADALAVALCHLQTFASLRAGGRR